MRKFLFGCALAITGFLPAAYAQDWCCPTQCDPCCCDEVGFEGFYIGGNIGVDTHEAHRNDYNAFTAFLSGAGWTTKDSDITVGVQLGYDWLCCNTLVGLVVDWNWANNEHTLPIGGYKTHTEFDWFTTIRARTGFVFCDSLFYITAGAAVSKFETRWYNGTNKFRLDHTRWGWVGGVGTEFQLWCNWSLGVELLTAHFGEKKKSHTVSTSSYKFGHSDNVYIGRILLNYRFGDLCGCLF